MKKFARICAILAAFVSCNAMAANTQVFDNLIAFGDSLSDVGNASGAPDTTPGGNTWVYYLGQSLGINISASNNGGNDYAFAGAVSGPNGAITIPPGTHEVIDQVDDYLAAHNNRIDSNILYTIDAGANDVRLYILEGNITPQKTLTLIEDGTQNIMTMVSRLHAAGANFIIVSNLPNIGKTPIAHALGPVLSGDITALSAAFNAQMLSSLNASGINVIQLDAFNFTNALADNYQLFNFIGAFNYYGDGTGGNVNQYIYENDQFHPSGETHLIYSQYAAEVLSGPLYAAILAHAPFAVVDGQNEAIRSQLSPLEHCYADTPVGKFSSFASGNYNTNRVDQDGQVQPGYNGDNKAFTVGGTYRFNQNGIVGVAVGRSMGDVTYAHNAGGFDLDENMITAFGGYYWNHLYGNAELTYGNIDFSNIKRNFMLGVLPETVTGSTTGQQFAAGGLLGYDFDLMQNRLKTGPVATLDWQHVNVKPYAETSSHFTQSSSGGAFDALQYDKQDNTSFIGGLGWQLNWATTINNTTVVPYLQATYNHPLETQNQKVYAGVTTLPGSRFYMPVTMPDSDFGLISTGVQTVFNSGLLLTFGYTTMVGEPEQHTQNFMISASMPV